MQIPWISSNVESDWMVDGQTPQSLLNDLEREKDRTFQNQKYKLHQNEYLLYPFSKQSACLVVKLLHQN